MYSKLKEVSIKTLVNVGDVVYVCPINNSMRFKNGTPFDYYKVKKVTKIGRKYLYLENDTSTKYGLGVDDCNITDISDYCADYIVFLSKEDFEIAREAHELKQVGGDIKGLFKSMSIEDKRMLRDLVAKYRETNKNV